MAIRTVTHFYANETIAQRESDGYVCLTDMAKAAERKISHYLENKNTKAYIAALSSDVAIPPEKLLVIRKGGNDKLNQGTWAHLEIAIHFAHWASPQFAVWSNRVLRKYIVWTPTPTYTAHEIEELKTYLPSVKSGVEVRGRVYENPLDVFYRCAKSIKPKSKEGHVYLIGTDTSGLVKIGFTADLSLRIKTLQRGSSEELKVIHSVFSSNARNLETAMHTILEDHRVKGEWFTRKKAIKVFKDLAKTQDLEIN